MPPLSRTCARPPRRWTTIRVMRSTPPPDVVYFNPTGAPEATFLVKLLMVLRDTARLQLAFSLLGGHKVWCGCV